jgi:NAD(P)-dependent dehydrogenase (short-subunit alcohol dehydrogenase family)
MSDQINQDRGSLLTGELGPLGLPVAAALARQGAPVVWTSSGKVAPCGVEANPALRDELAPGVMRLVASISDEAELDAVIDGALEYIHELHLLVHGALLVQSASPLAALSLDDWQTALQDGLRTPYLVARRLVEEFLAARTGGQIVFVADGSEGGEAEHAGAAAARTGLVSLARSIAREYGRRGITCNVVEVGSDLTAPLIIEDAVNVIAFLASQTGEYVTGQVLTVGPREGRWPRRQQ